MNENLPNDGLLRQLLLGYLDNQPELEESLIQEALVNDQLAVQISIVEDEIIEEYLDGTFDSVQKKFVEEEFLRPAERQARLLVARTLRDHFGNNFHVEPPGAIPPTPYWRTHTKTLRIIGTVIFSAAVFFIFFLTLRPARQSPVLQSPVVYVKLPLSTIQEGAIPRVEIGPQTKRIHLDLVVAAPLPNNSKDTNNPKDPNYWMMLSPPFDIVITDNAGNITDSREGILSHSSADGIHIDLDIEAFRLINGVETLRQPGQYQIALMPGGYFDISPTPKIYKFLVVTKK